MKTALIVFLALVILFAGCVQPPAPTGGQQPVAPTVVNVTQNQPAGTQGGAPSQPPPTTTSPPPVVSPPPTPPPEANAMPSGQAVSYTTTDGWKIYGVLYPAKNTKPTIGVILLHQKGSDLSSFDPLVPVLHDTLPNADILAIDMRGHGNSTNIGTYSNFVAGDYRNMVNDVKGATSYLSFFRYINNYYIVGSSIGSTVAIRYAATDSSVQKIVMLSPNMNYEGVDIATPLGQVRKEVFIIASDNDPQSSTDATTAYTDSNAPIKKLFLYKTIGPAHGTDMFAASESSSEGSLTQMIADWLKNS